MKNPANTHTGRMRGQYHYNRRQVLWLTGMKDEELSMFQFEQGMAWLAHYTNDEPSVIRWLMEQPMVWKWWVNEWNRRDALDLPGLYQIYDDQGTIGEWLANVDLDDDGVIVVTADGEMRPGDAEAAIRHMEVMVQYRMVHQEVFIPYYPPYKLLDKGWEVMMDKVRKGATDTNNELCN